MTLGKTTAARTAQVGAQVLTAWALVISLFDPLSSSVWTVSFLAVACLLPFRTKGTNHDRAVTNFGSGLVVWGLIAVGLIQSTLDYLMGTAPNLLDPVQKMSLAATVLFVFAGAFYWIADRGERRGAR